MKTIRIDIEPPELKDARLLVSSSLNDGHQHCCGVHFNNLTELAALTADFGQQHAHWLTPTQAQLPVSIEYGFNELQQQDQQQHAFPEAFWAQQQNRYTTASNALVQDIHTLIDTEQSVQHQIKQLILLAQERFSYGHAEARFNEGAACVPSVCGTTKGSCVDINTYILACANELNIPCQYVAGFWFHPEKTQTLDMHCWLQFRAGEQILPWDLAHHLKWGVDQLAAGLNPAGGRRVAMSYGRGLNFDSEYGPLCISHFSEPVWVTPDGRTQRPKMVIHIQEPTQVPA